LQNLLFYFSLFSRSTTDNEVFVVFGEDLVLDMVLNGYFFLGGLGLGDFIRSPFSWK